MSSLIKQVVKPVLDPFRPRLLPSIIVAGAQKAGTSALFTMLCKHTDIVPPAEKELNFFNKDDVWRLGLKQYKKMLPMRPWRGTNWTTLDATPSYLYHPEAAQRIHAALPTATIVVVIRDPVARAYSDWNMFNQFKGHSKFDHLHDPRPFEQAVQEELAAPARAAYLRRGHYAEQLARYFQYFPREQVLIFPYPQLKRDPSHVVNTICKAAGLDALAWNGKLSRIQANKRPYASPLPDHIKADLERYYEPRQEALWTLLNTRMDLQEQ